MDEAGASWEAPIRKATPDGKLIYEGNEVVVDFGMYKGEKRGNKERKRKGIVPVDHS